VIIARNLSHRLAETSAGAKNYLIAKLLTAPKALYPDAKDWFCRGGYGIRAPEVRFTCRRHNGQQLWDFFETERLISS